MAFLIEKTTAVRPFTRSSFDPEKLAAGAEGRVDPFARDGPTERHSP
jgi:hypothetical protein